MRLTTSLSMWAPNALLICRAIRGQPYLGFRCFISTMAWKSAGGGPFGLRLPCLPDEYSHLYLRLVSAWWNRKSVDGLIITADCRIRRGWRKNVQNPNKNRSCAERLGARRLDRLMTSSCCFIRRLSATTARAPPGPMSLAMVVSRWRRSIRKFLMAPQARRVYVPEQDCLNYLL